MKDKDALTVVISKLNPCRESRHFLCGRTIEEAWEDCERGDWMAWIMAKLNIDIKTTVKVGVECARIAQHLMKDERSLKALDVAEDFVNGKATVGELKGAADAAAYAARSAAAATAARSAAAATAAYAAADAAAATAAASAAATAYFAKKQILKKCADICRKHVDFSVIKNKLEELNAN